MKGMEKGKQEGSVNEQKARGRGRLSMGECPKGRMEVENQSVLSSPRRKGQVGCAGTWPIARTAQFLHANIGMPVLREGSDQGKVVQRWVGLFEGVCQSNLRQQRKCQPLFLEALKGVCLHV